MKTQEKHIFKQVGICSGALPGDEMPPYLNGCVVGIYLTVCVDPEQVEEKMECNLH